MKTAITMDAKSSKFHHGSVAVIDDNDAGNDKIINDQIQDLKREMIQTVSNPDLTLSEKTAKTKELGELIKALQNVLDLGKESKIINTDKNMDLEKKMDIIPHDEDIAGYKGHILLSRKDEYGHYYTFTNLNGDNVKYYYDNDNYKFDKKLSKIEDIPNWFRSLSKYFRSWNFDDVTQIKELKTIDKDEDEIIRKIIIDSMTGDMENYELEDKSGVEAILFIKQLLGEEFPRRVKDKLWKELVVDEFCTEPEGIIRQFTYMVNLEKWSHNKDDYYQINTTFLRTKIDESLTKNVKQEIINNFMTGKLSGDLRKLTTEQYIKAIRDSIRLMNMEYCESKNLTRIDKRKCTHCDSFLHYAKHCRKFNNMNTYSKGTTYDKREDKEENKTLRPSEIQESEY